MLEHISVATPDVATPDAVAPTAARADRTNSTPATSAGPIVVAACGGTGSDAALGLAYRLAGAMAADVQVVTVAEPPIVLDAYMGPMTLPPDIAPWLRARRDGVDRQLARAGLAASGWPVDVLIGEPSRRIAGLVDDRGARLVLVGRERHRAFPGRYGSGLALRLLRHTDVPVLSVAPSLAHLPRRVVVAVDFSPYSVHAARVALAVSAPDAVVHLMYVQPRERTTEIATDLLDFAPDFETKLPDAWHRVVADIGAVGDRQIETVTVTGDPATTLVRYAEQAAADLVASGTHGRGFIGRLFLGSVAETLLQHAPCSVLCVPGSALARAEHRRRMLGALRTRAVPASEWGVALDELTRSAVGRPCSVEVDHPGAGAQHLVEGLPFAGASYEARGGRVMLVFGATRNTPGGAGDLVLTHVVPDVRALDVASDPDGTVRAVRVADGLGQTILTFPV